MDLLLVQVELTLSFVLRRHVLSDSLGQLELLGPSLTVSLVVLQTIVVLSDFLIVLDRLDSLDQATAVHLLGISQHVCLLPFVWKIFVQDEAPWQLRFVSRQLFSVGILRGASLIAN